MFRKAPRSGLLARGLMLLAAILLFAAPALPAAAMVFKDDCCADTPCHGDHEAAPCPEACIIACQVVVTPEMLIVQPVENDSTPLSPMLSTMPSGRALAPELPPPR